MSDKEFPPRVSVRVKEQHFTTNTKGTVAYAVLGDRAGYSPYLSLAEHEALVSEARASAFEELAKKYKEQAGWAGCSDWWNLNKQAEELLQMAAAARAAKRERGD